jgi:hypothetical protein
MAGRVEVTVDDFDRIHRRVPVLANVKTTGRYPVEYFWYAGGVPAVMLELRDLLHLDCLTVTGKTLGENLEEIEQSPFFFAERRGYLNNFKIDKDEIIRPRSNPLLPRRSTLARESLPTPPAMRWGFPGREGRQRRCGGRRWRHSRREGPGPAAPPRMTPSSCC